MQGKIKIGEIICEHLKKEGRKKIWLAEQINCSLSGTCKILKRDDINSTTLLKISFALDHDFAQYLSEYFHKSKRNNNFAKK